MIRPRTTRRSSAPRKARTRPTLSGLESLETRELLASTITLDPASHVLTITGCNLNDNAVVNYGHSTSVDSSGNTVQKNNASQLEVSLTNNLGGTVYGKFATSSVSSIKFVDLGGKDLVQNGTSLPLSYTTSPGGSVSTRSGVVATDGSSPATLDATGVFTVGSNGQVTVDFLFDGGGYTGQTAIFSLAGMTAYTPGSAAFNQEAARRALSNSTLGHLVIDDAAEGARSSTTLAWETNYNTGSYLGVKSFAMTPGDQFGVMLVPAGSLWEVYNNPSAGTKKTPIYSMPSDNPGGLDQFVAAQSSTYDFQDAFAFEDMRRDGGQSDRDYNDIVLRFGAATGTAPLISSLSNQTRQFIATPSVNQILNTSTSFSSLAAPTIAYGAPTDTFTGKIATYVNGPIPTGNVSVTVNGVTQTAAIQSDGSFSCRFDTSTLHAGSYDVGFAYAANGHLNAASGSTKLTVNKATPTLTWANPAPILYGTALSSTQLNASAGGVDGRFSYSPPAGTVLGVGYNQTLSVAFSPSNSADYNTANASVKITVAQSPTLFDSLSAPAIVYATGSDTISGHIGSLGGSIPTGNVVVTLNGVSQNASIRSDGTFSTGFNTSKLVAGSYSVAFAYAGTTNLGTATGATTLTVNKATPTISWSTPSGITYGTALSSSQLNASANVAGSFSYGQPAGTRLNAGSQLLTALFTPTDTANYTAAAASVRINVAQAALTVTANSASKAYGAADPAFTVTYAGFLGGDGPAALGGSLSFTTNEPSTGYAPVGTYSVTPGGLTSANYAIKYVAGTLTVNSVAPTATLVTPTVSTGKTFTVSLGEKHDTEGDEKEGVRYSFCLDGGSLASSYDSASSDSSCSFTLSDVGVKHTITARIFTKHNGFTTYTTTVSAAAASTIVLLDPTGSGAFTASGSWNVEVGKGDGIQVNSTSASAVNIAGNGELKSSISGVAGGVVNKGSNQLSSPFAQHAAVADPLNMSLPTAPSTTYAAVSRTNEYSITLSPGTYVGGLHFNGSGKVTLAPGVYYLKGGGLSVEGDVSITGSGVLIVNAGTTGADAIRLGASTQLKLTPATNLTGDYAAYNGVGLMQDPASSTPITINGNAKVTLGGAIYAPRALLDIAGSATVNVNRGASYTGSAVLYDLRLAGNTVFHVDLDRDDSGGTMTNSVRPALVDAAIQSGGLTDSSSTSEANVVAVQPSTGSTSTSPFSSKYSLLGSFS